MSALGGNASYRLNGTDVSSAEFYAVACDPRRSVAVEACAGAGKTWMLVSRIVRALLDGAAAHEILAITFTKKAAGEMRQRLNDWLQEFAHACPEELQRQLTIRGVSERQAQALCEPLRQLQAKLLAHRRPVQIRTFHSWFAALLRNAPLSVLDELGLPATYELLEDDSVAVAQLWRPFHARVLQDAQARASYEAVVARHGRFATQQALTSALQRRVEFILADARGVVERCVPHCSQWSAGYADLAHPMLRWRNRTVRARWLACAAVLGAEKGQTAPKAAQAVIAALELLDAVQPDDGGAELALHAAFIKLRSGFFVADADRMTQHLLKFDAAMAVEAELRQLCDAMRQHQAWTYQQHMAVLTRLLVREYAALKRERGWVDMGDVESAAGRLLGDAALGAWVQERLDARTRHLLIDEFQDTNPLQWQALHAWLSAYAGSGGGAERPSLFIVGDPKQSIYRFRRAEPQVFLAAQAFVRELGGDLAECDHTRRNAPAVLAEVNRCMGEAQATGAFAGFRDHSTASTDAGGVFVLPPIARPAKTGRREAGAPPTLWRDSLRTPRITPDETLRTLECRQAAQWVDRQVRSGVPAGEILVLARKRDRLSSMQDELRALGVPALQPERLELGDAPEVQDMVALLDALVSPAHNLSLARALKSPLFGLGDDDLVQLALCQRTQGGHWLDLLLRQEGLPAHLLSVGCTLARWQQWVQTLPPHDALDAIFTDGDVLARFVACAAPPQRSGVLAHLQAMLWAALQLDGARYATPYALVRALRSGPVHAPSVADANAVRLLTVHGAKGLEARAVLVLDADAPPPKAQTMGVLIDWPGEASSPLAFVFLASESAAPPSAVHALAVEQAARGREELNALYVAMTRARQCLLLSSVEPAAAQTSSWWQRLLPGCTVTAADTPWPFALPEEKSDAAKPGATPYPDSSRLVLAGLPALTALSVPQPVGQRGDAAGGPEADADRSAIGQAMHRLLEWAVCGQTAFAPGQVLAVAREFALDPTQAAQAAAMAERILTGPGAWAWQADVLAWQGNEVSLVVAGASLRLDRLVRRADTGHWWVLDHKSNAEPQRAPELVAQLLQYRSAVQAVYPGEVVRAAFLTAHGELKEIA